MTDIEALQLVERFFAIGARVVGSSHPVAIFLAGCPECLPEWEIQVAGWPRAPVGPNHDSEDSSPEVLARTRPGLNAVRRMEAGGPRARGCRGASWAEWAAIRERVFVRAGWCCQA